MKCREAPDRGCVVNMIGSRLKVGRFGVGVEIHGGRFITLKVWHSFALTIRASIHKGISS